jgi:hypothetical protein
MRDSVVPWRGGAIHRPLHARALGGFLIVTALSACENKASPHDTVSFSARIETDSGVLRLSHAPNTLAIDEGIASLPSMAFPRAVAETLLHVADVATWPDGQIAILDRLQKHVVVIDSQRSVVRILGRGGSGPGEFTDPLALEVFGDKLVVLDSDANKVFTVFSHDGIVLGTTSRTVGGDWFGSSWRQPRSKMDAPFQTGPEDWTRRLVEADTNAFAYRIQDDERNYLMGRSQVPPSAYLVRYRFPGFAAETVWKGPVTGFAAAKDRITDKAGKPIQETSIRVLEKLWVDRPVLTSGAGWSAFHEPGANYIDVRFSSGKTRRIIWPQSTRSVDETDALAAALHVQLQAERQSDRIRAGWNKLGRDGQRAQLKSIYQGLLAFPDSLPELMAGFGDAECLWLIGVNPSDHYDGTARTIVGLNVVRPFEPPVVFRVGKPGSRIRDISTRGVITSLKDEDDVIRLEWHSFPAPGCGGPASSSH